MLIMIFYTNTQKNALKPEGYNVYEFVACLKIFLCNIDVSLGAVL